MGAASQVLEGWSIGVFRPSQERLERLGRWFHERNGELLRFAYFVCGDRDLAQDLVQDAFVKIYHADARLDDDAFGAYARRTILNLARSRFRRRTLERRHEVVEEQRVTFDPGERDEVWRALGTLSPQQRACVALRYYDDLSEKQIAAALGVSAGTVKKQTDRAMKKLRVQLGRDT